MPTKTKAIAPIVRELAKQDVVSLKQTIETASTEALKAELTRLLGFSAESLLRLAIITSELEKRGEDLSSIRFGLLPLLRKIACGELMPEIVVMFAGQPAALRKIAAMKKAEQEAIASGEMKFTIFQPSDYKPRANGSKAKPSFSGHRDPRKRPSYPEQGDAHDEAGETAEAIFHAENLVRLLKSQKVLKTDAAEKAIAELAQALAEAIFHAENLVRLLKSQKVLKTDAAEKAIAELAQALADRAGTVPADEIRRKAARFLGSFGRSSIKKIAEDVGVAVETLTPLLDHRWFAEMPGGYVLTTHGRREVD